MPKQSQMLDYGGITWTAEQKLKGWKLIFMRVVAATSVGLTLSSLKLVETT